MTQTADTQQSQPRKLLRVTEAAAQLGVSREQVYVLMRNGELPYVQGKARSGKPGWRQIEQAVIDAYIERNRATAP